MMPLAPTPIVPVPSKPKIGFSIDSIVGGGDRDDSRFDHRDRKELSIHDSAIAGTDASFHDDRNHLLTNVAGAIASRSPDANSEDSDRARSRGSSVESCSRFNPHRQTFSLSSRLQSSRSPSVVNKHQEPQPLHSNAKNFSNTSGVPSFHDFSVVGNLTAGNQRCYSGGSSPDRTQSPSPPLSGSGPVGSGLAQQQLSPSIVRPCPNYLGASSSSSRLSAVAVAEQLKFLNDLPGHGTQTAVAGVNQSDYHSQQMALANFAAQHFQAAVLQAQHGSPHGPYPHGTSSVSHPHLTPRESMPLYPWLLSRHGRIFPQRYPGGPDIPGFLLQPFRKPKRIRTAFSPSQLLKLEHAFEKNHYVIGAERKQLAQALSLSETQVKVWFQNRRTKHKRMQQEEEAKTQQLPGVNNNTGNSNKNTHHVNKWQQETSDYHQDDEEDDDGKIDPDDCSSDSEA